MDQIGQSKARSNGPSALRGLALIAAGMATAVAAVIAALLAIVFTATLAVIGLIGAAFVAVASLAFRARRAGRAPAADPDVIEARNMGGHSWVAYGWDQSGR
jgi:hypothetical protein